MTRSSLSLGMYLTYLGKVVARCLGALVRSST